MPGLLPDAGPSPGLELNQPGHRTLEAGLHCIALTTDTRRAAIYRVAVSTSLSPEEFRAAAETHHELGPAYRDAVIESFLDKVGREIDARVDARLARQQPTACRHARSGTSLALAITSMAFGIPLSAIAVAAGKHPVGFMGLLVIWVAIAAINIAYSVSQAARSGQPPDR